MYCPRCNLHSEEYIEKCPLCNGPMEADEVGSGVMETPTIPDRDDSAEELPEEESLQVTKEKDQEDAALGSTVALELDQEQIVGQAEQEKFELKDSKEEEKFPPPYPSQAEEVVSDQEERLYQEEPSPTSDRSGKKKSPLIFGGGITVILILGALGYFFLFPSEKPSKLTKTKVAVAEKKPYRTKASTSLEKPVDRKQRELTETNLKEPKEAKAPLQLEKLAPFPPVTMEKEVMVKKKGLLKPLWEAKKPLGKTALSESPSAKPEPAKQELATKTLADFKPPPPTTLAESQKDLSRPSEASFSSLPSSNPQGLYAVHVGSFKNKNYAFDLRDRLENKGYPIICKFVKIPGKGDWYRVKVGYYSSREDAQKVLSKLKTEEKVPTLILRRK